MRLRTFFIVAGLAVVLASAGYAVTVASAGPRPEVDAAVVQSPPVQADNDACLACHSQEGMSIELKSGETLPLTIDSRLYKKSTHGSNDIACVTCHPDINGYPHPERTTDSLRDVKIEYYTSCKQCHGEQFDLMLDGVHQKTLAAGNKNAAVCSDCHNPHTQQKLTDENGELLNETRLLVPETCAQCHSEIYEKYKKSVHGRVLTGAGNLDMPTCLDCHGVHNIQNPTSASFRNSTPYLCAKCHTDEALMSKYGLSTNVLDTYVSDFHGTTVAMFDKTFPDQPTNKPVCTDCHGVHDIVSTDDPNKGLQTRENLLKRCQVCHPDATANFPDAWMSHYIPSPETYPIVYYVNLFYKFFIPAVLLPMIILVVLDFGRATINRYRKPTRKAKAVTPAKVKETPPVYNEVPSEGTKPSDKEAPNG